MAFANNQWRGLNQFIVKSSYIRGIPYAPIPPVWYGTVGTPNDPYEIVGGQNNQPFWFPWPELDIVNSSGGKLNN